MSFSCVSDLCAVLCAWRHLSADEDGDVGSNMKVLLETFLGSLQNCVNRELIDKASTSGALLSQPLSRHANHREIAPTLLQGNGLFGD